MRFTLRLVWGEQDFKIYVNGMPLGALSWIPPKRIKQDKAYCLVHVEEEDLSYERITFWPEVSELAPVVQTPSLMS
eukprot:5642722-Karenia_brevis.AAC.1